MPREKNISTRRRPDPAPHGELSWKERANFGLNPRLSLGLVVRAPLVNIHRDSPPRRRKGIKLTPARWAFTPNLLPVDRGCPRKRLLQPERQAKAALQMKVSWIATGQNCPRLLGPWGMGHRYPPSAGLIS